MTDWITFVGEGRSGHTILSAILDSHPNVRMSEEQKYISKWKREDWSKDKILTELHKSGYGKERKPKALPGMLTYTDPLIAVGDKCGWDGINEIRKRDAPITLFDDFGKHMEMPVKIIHSVRNPFDNITAWLDSPKYQRMYKDGNTLHRRMIKRYRKFYDTAEQVLIRSEHVFTVYNEELCDNPRHVLLGLCGFLDLDPVEPWITNAINAVNKKPNRRSERRVWPEVYTQRVWDIIRSNTCLEYYDDKS